MRQVRFFKSLIFTYFVLLLCFGNATAATLHAIIVADTLDKKLSAEKDLANFKSMLQVVEKATQLKLELTVIDGESIVPQGDGYEKVMSTIKGLSPSSDDVVIFYYMGHGVMDRKGGEWPMLELQGNETENESLLRLDTVKTTLEQQNPRLLIVMADACNKYDVLQDRGRGEIILDELSPGTEGTYKSLFLNYKGYIIASGSERGQDSYSLLGKGGFFTRGFLTSFKEEVEASGEPSWENIMDNTREWVKTEVSKKAKQDEQQTPQAEIQLVQVSENAGNDGENQDNEQRFVIDNFDTASAHLKPPHRSLLKSWYESLNSPKSVSKMDVEIEGHTDDRGSNEYNLGLSERRAMTVKQYIVKDLRMDTDHVQTIPYGESMPVDNNDNESGRAQNRRVELVTKSRITAHTEPGAMEIVLPPSTPSESLPAEEEETPNTASCLNPDEIFRPNDEESSFGTCYWKDEDKSDWSVFAEERLWFNTWTGWYFQPGDPGHFIAATTENEMSHLITLGARYKDLTLTFSTLPSHSYDFPKISSPHKYEDAAGNLNYYEYQYESSADRQEMDVSLSYALMPELSVGVGFKHIEQKYHFYDKTYFIDGEKFNKQYTGNHSPILFEDYDDTYKIYGPTLVVGSQVCLANLVGNNISLFGNFSYGFLKMKWSDGNTDPTRYHSADLGISVELPKVQQLKKSEVRLGYRTQTMYTEANAGDGSDVTEGFTLGIRITF